MKIKLITDTGADLLDEEIIKNNILVVNLTVTFNNIEFNDTLDVFWNNLIDGQISKTSQPSPQAFINAFSSIKNDEIGLYISLSSMLSGTYQTAMMVKEQNNYDNIYIIDSKLASIGQKELVNKAIKLINKNLEINQIVDELELFKSKIKLIAALDSLKYLARGGRISKTIANFANILNLKVIISVTNEGIKLLSKAIGNNHVTTKLIEFINKENINKEYKIIPIYSYDNKNCQNFINKLNNNLVDKKMYPIGSTIGTHIGPYAFGVVFIEN